jgi:hypothetical protein
MVKIKFTCNWTSDHDINERVKTNFITEDNYDENIVITSGQDYDYLFCLNRLNTNTNVSKEKIFTFIMEPSWSPNWDRNCFNYSNKVFVHDKNLFGGFDNIIESPSFMFYHMDWGKHEISSLLNNKNFNKKNKVSMVVSYTPKGNHNYELRTKLALELINKGLDVDIYGNGWSSSHKNIKGPINDKYEALIDYQFSIGIENSSEKNYLTEKYFDISLCNGTPIYFGAPNVDEIYKNHIKIDLNNNEQCLDTISDVLNNKNLYNIEGITENKRLYFENNNLYNKVKEIVKNL